MAVHFVFYALDLEGGGLDVWGVYLSIESHSPTPKPSVLTTLFLF